MQTSGMQPSWNLDICLPTIQYLKVKLVARRSLTFWPSKTAELQGQICCLWSLDLQRLQYFRFNFVACAKKHNFMNFSSLGTRPAYIWLEESQLWNIMAEWFCMYNYRVFDILRVIFLLLQMAEERVLFYRKSRLRYVSCTFFLRPWIKWWGTYHTSKQKSLFIFQLLGECHCWWTKESPRAHVAKFYGRLQLISSILRASKFFVLKLTEIVILWVYNTIPFGFSLIWHFWGINFQLLNYFVWLRITDEGSVPEMRIWSILLIKSEWKWCIHLSRSLFSFFSRKWKRTIAMTPDANCCLGLHVKC